MSKLLSKAIAAVAIVLFWCMTTIGSTIATTFGTTIGATSLATAITAATSTPAEARRRWRRRGRYRGGATGGAGRVPASTSAGAGIPIGAGDTGGRDQSTIMKAIAGRPMGRPVCFW